MRAREIVLFIDGVLHVEIIYDLYNREILGIRKFYKWISVNDLVFRTLAT